MGTTEAYITLDEAARLEGVSYETTKKRAQRGKLETRNETRESGGKDITLVKVNSLSKQARNAYREQERLKALAADSDDIQEEQKREQPWYVDTDIDWYMDQYKERFYQAAELGNVVRQYLRETVGRYGDITAFAEEYAQKHLGKGYRTLYRMIKSYNASSVSAGSRRMSGSSLPCQQRSSRPSRTYGLTRTLPGTGEQNRCCTSSWKPSAN